MDRLDLLYGDNLIINEKLVIKHPKLIDIKKLGYEKYNNYINLLSMTPIDIADVLWFENNIWFEDLNVWKFFISIYVQYPEIQDALKWFTDLDFSVAENENGIYLYSENNHMAINEHFYMEILDFIKDINFIPDKSKLDISRAGNRKTKLYLLEQERKKRNKKHKTKIDLSSIVSSLIWKSGNDNVWNLPIFTVYEGYFRLNAIDNYDKTVTALYSGNIDTTKTKIDLDKINWSNIITI